MCLSLVSGCGDAPETDLTKGPTLLAGIDGIEWSVLLPLIREGKLPVFERLMKAGGFCRLGTLLPTMSPAIWNTVATGKIPPKHGILGFAYQSPDRNESPALYTSAHRKTKAFWNILTECGRRVYVCGWWTTYPAEEINGIMVSQTNTIRQLDFRKGRAVWKGTILKGIPGQVHPPEFQNRVMDIAAQVKDDLPELSRKRFGKFTGEMSPLNRRLWENSIWGFRADNIYLETMLDIIRRKGSADVTAVYFGGTDVVSHRFWRHMSSEDFNYKPTADERAYFGRIITEYYQWANASIEKLIRSLAHPGLNVMILSDHGFHAVNTGKRFDPDSVPDDINSGDHQDAPSGVFIGAGRVFRPAGACLSYAVRESGEVLPRTYSVVDITPTLLRLKGIPVGNDMDGIPMAYFLKADFMKHVPPTFCATHDSAEWFKSRESGNMLSGAGSVDEEMEQERLEQLRELGYIE